jgi:hypothetical protein
MVTNYVDANIGVVYGVYSQTWIWARQEKFRLKRIPSILTLDLIQIIPAQFY